MEYFNKVFGESKPKDIILDLTVNSVNDMKNRELRRRESTFRRVNKHLTLVTKKAEYDRATKTYRLDFEGRAKLPSTSNVQIVDEQYTDEVLLQLGHMESKTYALDYKYPFCAFSAFGVAISCLSRT